MKSGIAMWVRNEVAHRWKALVALGVLAGLVGGLAIAAVAGARRTSTAYERFREATGRSDAIVFGTLLGMAVDYTPVRTLPEVEDAGEFVLAPIGLKDLGAGQLGPNDDHLYRTINRPLLVAGRLPDPRREDELVINRQAAKQLGLGIGDRVTIESSTEMSFGSKPVPNGPSVEATVVGIGNSAMEFTFYDNGPAWVPSGAFLANHPEVPRFGNLVVRLRPGTDVAEFGRRAADALGLPNIPVRDLAEDTKRVTHGTDLERTALLLFAAAVALAGVVLVGQALTRTVYALAQPSSALRALGFTRGGLVAGLVLPLTTTVAVAAATAFASAVALSRWFPVGLAGQLESDRGVHIDWLVTAPGAAVVALAVLAGAALSALRATSPSLSRTRTGRRLSRVPGLARVAPLPAVIGAGLALERGTGERALPVRPALFGGIAAVLGVVGAFGLLNGIDGALAEPDRSGQFWDADVLPNDDLPMDAIVDATAAEPQVAEISTLHLAEVEIEGVGVPVYAMEPVKGSRTFTVLEGRLPVGAEETVMGPATAKALHRGIGDSVASGGPGGRQLRIVGLGLLPQTPHFSFDQGIWMSVEGFESIAPAVGDNAREDTVLMRFAGRSVEDGVALLRERLGPGAEIEPSSLPQDVAYLRNVRPLPKALAAFLVFLGLGALGHVLTSAVRRRRHDLAVLRALGFRPLQVAGCVVSQALTVSVVALLVGIPLGIAAGRWAWRWVAEATPLLYVPPLAAVVVLISIPAALLLANAMAALPARQAARLRPAEVLRAE